MRNPVVRRLGYDSCFDSQHPPIVSLHARAAMSEHRRRTRILATLGPATDPPGVLDALLRAGVNAVRLNFSHGDPSAQVARAQAVREAAQRLGVEVGILADLPGEDPDEKSQKDRVRLKAGDTFTLLARAERRW